MSHLDEGTLHALLDGELASTELMEIEAHLDGCGACSARLRAAREFLEESDRLVGSVQFGRFAATTAAAASPTAKTEKIPAAQTPPRQQTPPPPPPPPREHQSWQETEPVLLIPDNPEASPLLTRWPRVLGWAASITFVVSAGFLINNLARDSSTSGGAPTDAALPAAAGTVASAPAESDAVSPPAQGLRRDSAPTALAGAKTSPAAEKAPAAKPPTPAKPAPGNTDLAKAETTGQRGEAALKEKARATTLALAQTGAADEKKVVSREDSSDAAEEAATKAEEQEAIRVQAARALSQLDRERRASRANAATAALDRAENARRVNPAPAAPPPPPTVEQRTQVYLRIGLDEASQQLGGPVHVIEGMSPLFMGLAPGKAAAGADTTRPVVRVVYQDNQGRLIVLDQQRRRPGQPANPARAGSWSLGDLTMGLSGEAPAEVLRSLRSRVR